MILKCKYCDKECKNNNSLAQHEIRCKLNPNKIDLSYIKPGHSKGHKGTNQFIKAKELGLSQPIVSNETRIKLGNIWKGKTHTDEEKIKISQGIRKAIINNPESYSSTNVNGRIKHYIFNGIKLDGLWELEVAKYLEENNIKWERPKNGFTYMWNNSEHIYFPDFYLPEYNYYIEVKGYQRERDLYKWQSVEHLIIIKQKEIENIRNNKYDISIYLI